MYTYPLYQQQHFRILTTFQDFNQILGFQPNFRISTKFQDFEQILGQWNHTQNLFKNDEKIVLLITSKYKFCSIEEC